MTALLPETWVELAIVLRPINDLCCYCKVSYYDSTLANNILRFPCLVQLARPKSALIRVAVHKEKTMKRIIKTIIIETIRSIMITCALAALLSITILICVIVTFTPT